MRPFLAVLAGLVGGYLLGAALGGLLIDALSSNTHDKALETVMTAAFVTGPVGALLGALAASMWWRQRHR